tara:strand:- start:2239 stop:3735 length:1497 start_codon:yes stop_codon:yes gene_type:complete
MKRRQGWLFLIIFLLFISFFSLLNNSFQLGLDLKGGSQLTLQLLKQEGKVSNEELESVKAVLDRRINNLGLSESNLQTLGTNQIIVELPGQQNPASAARVLGQTAMLEFGIQSPNSSDKYRDLDSVRNKIEVLLKNFENINNRRIDDNTKKEIETFINEIELELNYKTDVDSEVFSRLQDLDSSVKKEIAKLFIKTDLTGKYLINAGRNQQQSNSSWEVSLTFDNEGGEIFANITKDIAGTEKLLGIILDGESISEAGVSSQYAQSGITGGRAVISSSSFNAETAKQLEVNLRGGSLPIPIEIVESNTIGPSLGSKNIIKSFYAAIFGLLFVGLFMILNYRILGFVSVFSLFSYGIFNLALYCLIPITLTLPGIAGLILSIGMAVDANILIFERIREELKSGNTLVKSINNGFQRANSSIIDGHLTTLITCLILFLLGTSFVKGFAVTLGIGVCISLFTSLNCSKTLLSLLTGYQSLRQKKYYISNTKSINSMFFSSN